MYADKYLNHFLFIVAGRARFATFARYTLNGLRRPGSPEPLMGLDKLLETVLTKFEAGVVQRVTGEGVTQGNTATAEEQWKAIQVFVHTLDIETVRPAYHASAADLLAIYPDKISGLTQAKQVLRLSRFTAYTEALQARSEKITKVPAAAARQLLVAYAAVADAKQSDKKDVTDTIATLGPDATALCVALWEVHTLALYTYRAEPARAAAFFNYDLLPQHVRHPAAVPPASVPA